MADNFKFAQLQPFTLAGAGAVIGDTSIILSSMQSIDGVNLAMTDFGTKGFITLEPGVGTQEEQISFTGLVQNANGTATLSGVSSVTLLYPYTATSGLRKTHAGGTSVIVSNTSGFYDELTSKDNDETINGTWTFNKVPNSVALPVNGTDLANKAYVLSVVSGGTVSFDQQVISGTAGETIVAGQGIYLKVSDGRWWKTTAATASTVDNNLLGVAMGAGTAGVAITGGILQTGVLTKTGLTPNTKYYFGDTAGSFTTSAGTTNVTAGYAFSSSQMYFYPRYDQLPTGNQKDALAGDTGTPSATNPYATKTSTQFRFGGTGADGALAISSGTTTLNVGGAAIYIKNYSSISITGTGALAFSNPHANGTIVILKCRGDVTITSSAAAAIDTRGMGSTVSGGVGLQPTGLVFTGSNAVGGGMGGLPATGNGGTAGSVFSFAGFYTTSTTNLISKNIYLVCGAAGGNAESSGNGTPGVGGRGGGALYIECRGALNITSTINSSGTNGTASTQSSNGKTPGGGGGGSAGQVLILYNTLTANSATITAIGGNGGNSPVGVNLNAGSSGGGGGAGSLAGAGGAGGAVTVNGTTTINLGAGGGGAGGNQNLATTGGLGGSTMGGLIALNTELS